MNVENWKRCESFYHVGDELDPTVEWRDLGLMCNTCIYSLVDVRHIKKSDRELMLEERVRELELEIESLR